ncbi:protein of unknown function [Methylocaldum szegediense]|uniref:Uncharacterized protein n=1 Tax=Methylocaldum szegediense TaxID=73780 RepID=A0ABM9HWF8_9GAMM|nr:protein of unknown function [Methylocaldum szegediense]
MAGERLAPHAATALANTALGLGYGLILMGFYALRPPVGAVQDLSGHWPTLRCFLPRKQSVLILPKAPLATARVLPALQEDRSRLEGLFGRSPNDRLRLEGLFGRSPNDRLRLEAHHSAHPTTRLAKLLVFWRGARRRFIGRRSTMPCFRRLSCPE